MENCFKVKLVYGIGLTIAALGGLVFSEQTFAQVTPDRTLGSERSVVNQNVTLKGVLSDRVDGGARRGANLFHSFLDFNVAAGRGVYFGNPAGVGNILSRVTGGNASSIAGRLGVLGGANLFLLNPNGIIFGPNASLDVAGSFVGSTASSLRFGDGTEYSATNPDAPSLLMVSVPLGVQFGKEQPRATITNRGNLTTGQDLTLEANNLDLQGQLQAGGNLTLKATDTVKIRDTVTEPFVAQSGNQLQIQGNQGIDIFALSHPSSGLFSGGDMVLQSANTVGGDAHYFAGGSFQIEQLNGSPGNLFSPYDPIVLAVGNVRIGDYGGASLHILAGGSVELGNVIIDRVGAVATTINPNNANFIPGTTTQYSALSDISLSDGTPVVPTVNGNTQRTLDVRAGIDWKLMPFTGVPVINSPTAFPPGTVTFLKPTSDRLSSDITISSIENRIPIGQILLTNQFKKNSGLNNGFIKLTGSVAPDNSNDLRPFSISAYGIPVTIDSRGDVQIAKGIVTGTTGFKGGNILIFSGGNVDVTGEGNVTNNIGSLLSLTDKDSGDITIKASGNINTGRIDTEVRSSDKTVTENNAGNVILTSVNGEIDTTKGAIISKTPQGKSGYVTITASGDIKTNDIDTQVTSATGTGSAAGNVILTSMNGKIDTTKGAITSQTPQGKSGDITLTANENVYTRNIIASNKSDVGREFSTISITSLDGSVVINKSQDGLVFPGRAELSTTNDGSGISGLIFINSGEGKNIEIANSDILSKGFYGEINIGLLDIRNLNQPINQPLPNQVIINNSKIDTRTILPNGKGTLNIPGLIQIRSKDIWVENNSNITAATNSLVQPGFITLDAKDSVSIRGGSRITSTISSDSGLSGSGFTPAITVLGNSIQISNPLLLNDSTFKIDASTSGIGQGADVILIARDGGKIAIDNYRIETNGNSPAGGGKIRIYGGSLSLNNGSTVRADDRTLIGGKAGEIQIGALTSQEIENIKTQLRANIDVTQPITDFGSPFSLQTLEANNSRISTSTKAGNAGTITVDANQSVSLSGGTGLLAKATIGGTAGDIRVVTPKLTVTKGAEINVSSPQGSAGNLYVFANSVLLNQGTLSATTGQNPTTGANIFLLGKGAFDPNNLPKSELPLEELASLPALDFLLMRNGSKISANAAGGATGGNILINSRLLLATGRGNDISANAELGKGGAIKIIARPLGIYNIEFRQFNTLSLNDITATSRLGANGIVSIAVPDVSPARDLNQLSEDLADASRKIAVTCPIAGQRGAANQFVVTGRGSLPETPDSALNSNVLVGEQPLTATQPDPRLPTAANTTETPSGVEAQGVEIGAKGEFILTARPSGVKSSSPWQPFQNCVQQ